MNDGRQSAKAMSLYKKSAFLRDNNDGKNVFLLTATPLTNSPLEYYNMLQHIASDELKRFGINSIDGFIKEFADIEEGIKYDWTKNKAGWGKILVGFKNLRALQDLFFKYTDLQNDPKAINLEKPEPLNVPNVIKSDKSQTAVLKEISEEIERYRATEKEEREIKYPGQNFLTFYSQMRTASLDLELFDPEAYKDWRNPKLEKLAENAKAVYEKSGGGQVVFCDRIFDSEARFNLHDKIKSYLVEKGFSEHEIVLINGFTKSGGKRSDGAIEKDVSKAISGYNAGKYKIIIGTTACIGEGVNLQKNSSAVHHFDIPFRPSDFTQRNGRVDRQGNEQKKVALHSYLATGTIDNYSAALVQNKANWIDILLRTKSNTFTNPNDENSVDMNALLLSLTEEWGDKNKADALREELKRQKEEAEHEAWNKKLNSNLKSLSLMRCSIQSVKNKDGADYKNRIDKIRNLERALKDNPLFAKHELLGNLEPFLYNTKTGLVIRKGDFLVIRGMEIVTGFDFKKQTFTTMAAPDGGDANKYDISKVTMMENEKTEWRFRPGNSIKYHFENPPPEQKSVLRLLNDCTAFYSYHDKNVVRDYYKTHLACFTGYRSDEVLSPLVFSVDANGKLNIGHSYNYDDVKNALNPFDASDKEKILKASAAGIETFYASAETLFDFTKNYLPEISEKLIPYLKDFGIDAAAAPAEIEQQKIINYGSGENISFKEYEMEIQSAIESATDKEAAPAQRLKVLLEDAVENDRVPWEKELSAADAAAPFDYETGRAFSCANLIAASLHMAQSGSKDPRYLSEEKTRNSGLKADDKAVPLYAAYRIAAKNGSYLSRTVKYYNVKDIAGIPEFRKPKAANENLPPITPERAASPLEQIKGNMAGFIAALSSGRAFSPQSERVRPEDYRAFGGGSINDVFSTINSAAGKAAGMVNDKKENQLEFYRQAAGLEK
jgi:hypothetical protein